MKKVAITKPVKEKVVKVKKLSMTKAAVTKRFWNKQIEDYFELERELGHSVDLLFEPCVNEKVNDAEVDKVYI